MIYPRTKEGYLEYLKSDHWAKLRAFVLKRDRSRCVRCGASGFVQVHHKVYRSDWERALVGDLETLCRPCHEKEHPDKIGKSEPRPEPLPVKWCPYSSYGELLRARSSGRITREQFISWRQGFGMTIPHRRKRKKLHGAKKIKWKPYSDKPWRPVRYKPRKPYVSKWVNRGSTTN